MRYSVRKWFYVDTVVEADSPEQANDIVENDEVNLKNLEYYGDLDNKIDVFLIEQRYYDSVSNDFTIIVYQCIIHI